MTVAQLNSLCVMLEQMSYPYSVTENFLDGSYHVIKCRQEKIPPEVCKILVDAPDFDGIMVWNAKPRHGMITFSYIAHT